MSIDDSIQRELDEAERELHRCRERVLALRRAVRGTSVAPYTFQGPEGATVRLSELFGDMNDLIVVHNMGKSCPYCTLWADGFNGLVPHLENRAAFVVVSPDAPAVQQEFAQGRGWRFRMLSCHGTSFAADMGYQSPNGKPTPGVSTFQRRGDGIVRIATAPLGPGDDFCALWHLFSMLEDGPKGWQPKFSY